MAFGSYSTRRTLGFVITFPSREVTNEQGAFPARTVASVSVSTDPPRDTDGFETVISKSSPGVFQIDTAQVAFERKRSVTASSRAARERSLPAATWMRRAARS